MEDESESEKENIIEEEKEKLSYLEIFDKFRKKYPGTKRGNETEFNDFKRKHKDWKEILSILEQKLDEQILIHKIRKEQNRFIEEWKHLKTWLNQRYWEADLQKNCEKKHAVQDISELQIKDILQGNFEKPVTDYFLNLFIQKENPKSIAQCEYLASKLSKEAGRDMSAAVNILKGTVKTSSI